jgi:prepilin-type N-terminal cleavage/methylation domain-containing protein
MKPYTLVKQACRRLQRGFSLVEIAVVLVVVGFALGAGIAILNVKVAQAKIDTTKVRVEAVRVALVAYVSQYYRMPCPAAPGLVQGAVGFNVEQRTVTGVITTCLNTNGITNNIGGAGPLLGVSRGTVPCTTLGLTEDLCYDGWGTRLTYFVDNRAVNLTQNTISGMRGTMTVHKITPPAVATPTAGAAPTGNQINACSSVITDKACNQEAVAVLVSHGANRGGGFLPGSAAAFPVTDISTYELENTDNDIQFLQNDYVEKGTNSFDDIVLAVVPREVVASLSQTGIVRLPNAVTLERLELIKQAILQKAYTNGTVVFPSTTTRTLVLPSLGTPTLHTFTAGTIPLTCGMSPTTIKQLLNTDVPALPTSGSYLVDGWNNPIRYSNVVTSLGNNATCSVPLVLVSYGPDGVQSVSDDITYIVTFAEIDSIIKKSGGW